MHRKRKMMDLEGCQSPCNEREEREGEKRLRKSKIKDQSEQRNVVDTFKETSMYTNVYQ